MRPVLFVVAVVMMLGCAALPSTARALPGDLDPAFGVGGIALTSLGAGLDKASAMAVQPDGKYVVAGMHSPLVDSADPTPFWTLVRFNEDGSVDSGFGIDGVVIGDDWQSVLDILCLPADGSFIVASGASLPTLSRFLADGSRDMDFGVGGVVQLDSSAGFVGASEEVRLASRADGSFLARKTPDRITWDADVSGAGHFLPDGTSSTASGLSAVRWSTSRVVAGTNSSHWRSPPMATSSSAARSGSSDTVLVRLTSSGRLDPDFGLGGAVVATQPFDFSDHRPGSEVRWQCPCPHRWRPWWQPPRPLLHTRRDSRCRLRRCGNRERVLPDSGHREWARRC